MVDVFGININESIYKKNLNYIIRFISSSKAEKIMKFYDIRDSYRGALGEIIARYAICYRNGLKNQNIEFSISKDGKPNLIFPKKNFFNISHSGDWVICAISNNIVGVDVEMVRKPNLKIAKRFFSASEYEFLLGNSSKKEQEKLFYKIWTLKESYVKADGRGLVIPLNSFSINLNRDIISIYTENNLKNCFFKTFEVDDKYTAAVCSVEESINSNITKLNINDVMEYIQKT